MIQLNSGSFARVVFEASLWGFLIPEEIFSVASFPGSFIKLANLQFSLLLHKAISLYLIAYHQNLHYF